MVNSVKFERSSLIKSQHEEADVEDEISDFIIGNNSDAKTFLETIGVKYICGNITQKMADDVVSWILAHNLIDKRLPELTIIITSYGGSVDHCFAILDMIKGSAIPIRTIGTGVIASCGLMLFMAGHTRVLTPTTSILSHQWSGGGMFEKEHELLAVKKTFELTSKKILDHYKTYTGLTEEVIREKLLPPHDVWLTAEEALALHLCDEIKLIGN